MAEGILHTDAFMFRRSKWVGLAIENGPGEVVGMKIASY